MNLEPGIVRSGVHDGLLHGPDVPLELVLPGEPGGDRFHPEAAVRPDDHETGAL